MPAVRVVVVNYEGGAVTLRCVDALLRTELADAELEIVVVDNASSDDVVAQLRDRYPQVRVIQNAANEGFARGCNVAMQDLDGVDFVALINNDAIVEPGWLLPLLAASAPKDVGAVSPKLLLNLYARAIVLEAPVSSTLPDGRRAGVGVRSLQVDSGAAPVDVRFDERFWVVDGGSAGVRWTRRPTASVWWPVEHGAPATDVTVGLVAVGSTTVSVGDGVADQRVEVGPGGTSVHVRLDGVRRIVNSAGGALYEGWMGGDRGFLEPDLGQYDEPTEVFAWSGGAVLLKCEYLRDVGLFDPTFFLYYEDFDLSWRGRSRGWRYLYEPSSVVFHEHMYSSKPGSEFHRFWSGRNRRLTLVKNAPAGVAARAVVGVIGAWCRRRASVADSLRILAGVPHALAERRRIAKRRVVGAAEIRAWMTTK